MYCTVSRDSGPHTYCILSGRHIFKMILILHIEKTVCSMCPATQKFIVSVRVKIWNYVWIYKKKVLLKLHTVEWLVLDSSFSHINLAHFYTIPLEDVLLRRFIESLYSLLILTAVLIILRNQYFRSIETIFGSIWLIRLE